MERSEIIKVTDHTLLRPNALWTDVQTMCDEAVEFGAASICIAPCFVSQAAEYLDGKLPIDTVIGFPNGYSTPETKVFEAKNAVKNGASEIDMVINIGKMRERKYYDVLDEIRQVRDACTDKILKVIIETCYLDQEEKVVACSLISQSGADFIKTSTGFGFAGATEEDIILMRKYCKPELKIKASGGIRSFELAERLIKAGADRIGASALVKLAKRDAQA